MRAPRYDAIGRSYTTTREEDEAVVARLRDDLESGASAARNAGILGLAALDVGCRILIAP